MPKYVNTYYYIFLSVLLFIILWGFWQYPVSLFDEALYANNALEMSHTNNFFVLTLEYKPDLYNTKPPLAIWLMAASIKFFGANEWAIRLPSVLAFILLLIVLIRFSKKYFNNILPGIVADIVLLGSQGFIVSHGARSGDLDSLLVLFSTLFVFSCIGLLVGKKENVTKSLIKCSAFLTLSYFIKSTTVFLFLPGLLACLLLSPTRRYIIRQKLFFILPVVIVVLIALYYWIMDRHFPVI